MRLANIPEINHRVNKPFPYDAAHFSNQLASVREGKPFYIWMIENDGKVIGVINNAAMRHARIFQGGYWIDPACWGMGGASSSLALVRDFLFNECSAERVQALVEPDNIASMRVLEKCGYQREGLLKKFYHSPKRGLIDAYMYAVVR